jgi:stearoyl-CoA desaturase (delta-9 desaturase)
MHLLVIATVTVVILQMSVFFTTIYLHRSITHRGLLLHPVVANLMHLHLSLFTGLIPREWAAVHRKHHHFSDKEGDPHSPYLLGLWHVLFGNYFYYKREANNEATVRKYTPDYRPDLIDRIPLIRYGLFGGLLIFMALFGWKWGLAAWLFHIVGYVLLNSSINSLCHMIGYRNFNNKATNLQSVAFLTGGEGLHNNHHAFPSSARFALRGREIDPAWLLIRLLESIGLAEVKPEPLAKAA